MKKSIIALAVSTALVVPLTGQADTILYGSARVSVDYVDEGGNSLNDLFDSDGFLDVTDNSSRLGVLGSEELGGGLSAIYQYEFGVDITEGGNLTSNRPKFVGLKGGFGQISVGTQETPYYHIVGIADTFNSGRTFGPGAWLGGAFALDAVGELSNVRGPGDLVRSVDSLYYATPDVAGFGAEAMLVMDGVATNSDPFSKSVDIWNVALKYSNGPFFAGLSYIKINGDSNIDLGKNDFGQNVVANFDLDQ
ncbi:MAG: porin, partial [Candidatus Competibacter sp.]